MFVKRRGKGGESKRSKSVEKSPLNFLGGMRKQEPFISDETPHVVSINHPSPSASSLFTQARLSCLSRSLCVHHHPSSEQLAEERSKHALLIMLSEIYSNLFLFLFSKYLSTTALISFPFFPLYNEGKNVISIFFKCSHHKQGK